MDKQHPHQVRPEPGPESQENRQNVNNAVRTLQAGDISDQLIGAITAKLTLMQVIETLLQDISRDCRITTAGKA